MDKELRAKIQHLWCQHCRALQKSSEVLIIDCWYNPFDEEAPAFCAANEDAIDEILKFIKEAGYRKLKGEPPVLSDEEILQIYHHLPDAETDAEMAMLGGEAVAQAQREADIGHYEGV